MSSDPSQTLERQPGKGVQLQLALDKLDDAFSDGDDQPVEFNSAALRRHLAEQPHWNSADQPAETSSVDEPDTSISTLYLDGTPCDSESRSDSASAASRISQWHTPIDEEPPQELSSIPLSDEPEHQDPPGDRADAPVEPDPADEEPVPSHPAVHINASDSTLPSDRATDMTPNEESIAASNGERPARPSSSKSSAFELPAIPPSPSLPTPQMDAPQSHSRKPSRSTGPTILQKVMSKTRPHFLPPKNRQEDQKHLADWETMMKQSRMAEEKRRNALQERRLARELRIEQSIHVWQKEVIPDWRAVHRDPALRKLWWNGIPTKLRASMWEHAIGNALILSKESYRTCLSRAKRALSTGVFPADTLHAIEEDILATLPALHIFHPETGPLHQDLKDLLCAWVVSRADEGLGYTPGTSRIAAMILINMPASQGFIVMRNLLERHCLRSFYGGISTKEDVEAYYRIFDTLLADCMPKIYFNFKQHQISPGAYLPSWLVPLFLDHLPFEACARIWDVVMLEGDSFLFRAALAMLAVLEPRLFFPERQELLNLLGGENKAAIEVARRDGRPLNGAKYEIYGVDEETLWERIESMEEWWKDTTWRRLTQRELPDI